MGTDRKKSSQKSSQRSSRWYILFFTLIFITIFIVSFRLGKYPVSFKELFTFFFSKIMGKDSLLPKEIETVIFRIRLPRIVSAAMVGAGLSAAGAAFQGLFQNPMVAPDLLGASSGAGFGAALAIFFSLGSIMVTASAFVFGLIAVIVSYAVSKKATHNQVLGLVLAGIMVSSLFQAATSYLKLVADPHNTLPAITYWLMGTLASVRWEELLFAGLPIILGLVTLYLLRWPLNIMTLGEEEAISMGVHVKGIRVITIIAATLVSAACVSIGGMIGWIGLIIPHFSRMLVGYDYRVLLPVSMLMGGSFLMVVDNFARLLATVEIPIGILIAFIGAPFFIYLILDRGKEL